MTKKLSPIKFIKRVNDTLETSKTNKKDTDSNKKRGENEKKLTKRQLFIEYYVQTLNATQAAINAGYSPKTARLTGHRLITNDNIKAKIDELLKQRLENCKVDTEFILQQLKDISLNPHCPFKDRVKALSLLGDYLKMWSGESKPLADKFKINLTD